MSKKILFLASLGLTLLSAGVSLVSAIVDKKQQELFITEKIAEALAKKN